MMISLRLFSTPALEAQVKAGKDHRRLRFAVLKLDLREAPLPRFLVRINLPTTGIVRRGLDAYVLDGTGRPLKGAQEMREAEGLVRPCDLIGIAARQSNLIPVAWTGSGNTVQNMGCVAFMGDEHALLYNIGEGQNIIAGKSYPSVIFYKNSRVAIHDLSFAPSGLPGRWNVLLNSRPINDAVYLLITGQRLLRDGVPLDQYNDAAVAATYPDKRHLLLNPYPKMTNPTTNAPVVDHKGNPVRKDFGVGQLSADDGKYYAALTGAVTRLSFDLVDVDGARYTVTKKDLTDALHEKGYVPCSSLDELRRLEKDKKRGYYWIDEPRKELLIIFKPSPYPHHFLAIQEQESPLLYDGVIGGWSNNGGTNPLDLAKDLALAGLQEAILLDNAGDCVLCHHGDAGFPSPAKATIPSCESREEWAGVIMYHESKGGSPSRRGITVRQATIKEELNACFVCDVEI